MKYLKLISFFFVCFALTGALSAQGPIGDEVMITFDQSVQVGSQTLPAGKYTIKQVTSASNPRVVEFTSDNGTRLDATVTAIPVLKNTPPADTQAVMDNEGGTARLRRLWIQGKNYGYEFPGKTAAAATTDTARLEGRFDVNKQPAVVAQAAPPPVQRPEPRPEPAPRAKAPEPAPARAPEPPTQIAQAEPAPQPQVAQNTPAPSPQPPARTPDVPATALNWVQLMLGGFTLIVAALLLYHSKRLAKVL